MDRDHPTLSQLMLQAWAKGRRCDHTLTTRKALESQRVAVKQLRSRSSTRGCNPPGRGLLGTRLSDAT